MTTPELIAELAKRSGYTRREVKKLLRHLAETFFDVMGRGCDIQLDCLGMFENKPGAWKTGRERFSGERFMIPPLRYVKFHPSAKLKRAVRKSDQYFIKDDPLTRYLPRGPVHGKVRSSDRPTESRKREAGWKDRLFPNAGKKRSSRPGEGD